MGLFSKRGPSVGELPKPVGELSKPVQTNDLVVLPPNSAAQPPQDKALAHPGISERLKRLNSLFFLADAPEFIDGALVSRLYETICQPEFEVASRSIGVTNTRASELSAEIAAGAEVAVPAMFKLQASSKAGMKDSSSAAGTAQIVQTAIYSPERRLEDLLNLYVYSYPHRVFWIDGDLVTARDFNGAVLGWPELEAVLDENDLRPLVVFDLQPGAKLIPMFGELVGGKPVPLSKNLLAAVDPSGRVPKYPTSGSADYEQRSKEYWTALSGVFDSDKAMNEVELATKDGGRLEWIDFRTVGIKPDGQPEPIHLHLSPCGKYSSGTFGYQFIRRAEKYGLRIIGRLKKGSDVDVLAFYQR